MVTRLDFGVVDVGGRGIPRFSRPVADRGSRPVTHSDTGCPDGCGGVIDSLLPRERVRRIGVPREHGPLRALAGPPSAHRRTGEVSQ